MQGTLHFNTQILSTFHNYDGVLSRCNSQMFVTPGKVYLSLITQNAVFKIKTALQFGDYLDRQNKKVTSFRDRWRVFCKENYSKSWDEVRKANDKRIITD